jgi:hypothetical protein
LYWFTQRTDARLSPIRIKAAEFTPKGKSFSAPGSYEPQKIVGAKPCPIVLTTTGLMVLRRNGPDPAWFKAWAYQFILIVDTTKDSRLRGLPIRSDGF